MVTEILKWNGWTVDKKLRQFRKPEFDENHSPIGLKMVDFDSEDGRQLFWDYCDEQKEYHNDRAGDYLHIEMEIENDNLDDEDEDALVEDMELEIDPKEE